MVAYSYLKGLYKEFLTSLENKAKVFLVLSGGMKNGKG